MNRFKTSILTILCLLLIQNSLDAQDSSETKTLFGNKSLIAKEKVGFFVAPAIGFSKMAENDAALFSIRGGVSFNDKLSIVAFYNVSLNQIRPENEIVPNIYLDYWSSGLLLEYTLLSKKLVHLTFPLYLGYGEVQMDSESEEINLGEANFFLIEPSALIEINLIKNVRFNVGVGYRFIEQMNYRSTNQSDFTGLTGYAGIKIGLFK